MNQHMVSFHTANGLIMLVAQRGTAAVLLLCSKCVSFLIKTAMYDELVEWYMIQTFKHKCTRIYVQACIFKHVLLFVPYIL